MRVAAEFAHVGSCPTASSMPYTLVMQALYCSRFANTLTIRGRRKQ